MSSVAELTKSIGAPPAIQGTAYTGADLASRELGSWQPSNMSAGAELLPELGTLTARSRDLERNHAIMSGVVNTLVENVVGTGFRLIPRPDYKLLGQDREWAREWSATVGAYWRVYAESKNCDATRESTFADLCSQAYFGRLTAGDAIGLPLWKPGKGRRFSTVLQLIEADRLCNKDDADDTPRCRRGVVIDASGEPTAYWIRSAHPGDDYRVSWADLPRWKRIPARTSWGRQKIIHAYKKYRAGQYRGRPIFAPVMADVKMLDHFRRVELQSAIASSMIAGVLKSNLKTEEIVNLFGGEREGLAAMLEARSNYRVQLQGGAFIPIFPGDELQSFTPNRPGNGYAPFMESGYVGVTAALGVPYQVALKDFRHSNYSNARAALNEARRHFRIERDWLTNHWCLPHYWLWLEELINSGRVKAPGYYDQPDAYGRAVLIGNGWGQIDEVKESQAAQIRMDIGLSTLADECAAMGLDWREVLEQRALEQEKMAELGLTAGYQTQAARGLGPGPTDEQQGAGGA